MLDQNIAHSPRLLRIDAVANKVAMGKSTILAWEATGRFPRAFRPSSTLRLWLESDIDGWISELRSRSQGRNFGAERLEGGAQ